MSVQTTGSHLQTAFIALAYGLLSGCTHMPPQHAELPAPPLGMWVWSPFSTPKARADLLSFCAREGISHIDQHISIHTEGDRHIVADADALTALVTEASRRGITVSALRGDPKMFFADKHAEALADIRAIVAFDRQLPDQCRLAGLKFDVEPYSTPEWRAGGNQRTKVMVDYLSFLRQAEALLYAKAPHLDLAVDVPFWWDNPELTVTFEGKEKLLIEHIQDHTDCVGLMSYRPSAEQILHVGRREMLYAAKIGKTICFGVETGRLAGQESWISFWPHPPSHFRGSLRQLQAALAGNRAVRSIMIHHYGSLVDYLNRRPNKRVPAQDA